MSTTYSGTDLWPDPVTLADDGDRAAMTIIAAAFESVLDRTTYLLERARDPKLIALGSMPYVTLAARFSTDYNVMNVVTATAVGDTAKWSLNDLLVHGGFIEQIDVLFIPETSHAGLPATPPTVALIKWAIAAGAVPAGAPTVVSTVTYGPVSLGDYIDGEVKVIELVCLEDIDLEAYLYQLVIVDESGANAIVGNAYVALRVLPG